MVKNQPILLGVVSVVAALLCLSSTVGAVASVHNNNNKGRRRTTRHHDVLGPSLRAVLSSAAGTRRTSSSCPTTDHEDSAVLVRAATRRRTTRRRPAVVEEPEDDSDLVPYDDDDEEEVRRALASLEEIRASLGPVGRFVANSVEVGIVTGGSYVSGGVMGYGIGGVLGLRKTVFRNPGEAAAPLLDDLKRRAGDWNTNALTQAGQWARLLAAFTGFYNLSRVVRGGREDKWNGILGGAATGAYLSREKGPQAMLQGGASYAGITYLLDTFFVGGGVGNNNNKGKNGAEDREGEFGFTDTPADEEY